MVRYSTLDLGAASDARIWERGCAQLGMTLANSLIKPSPTLAELTEFFNGWPNWVYFSGHFSHVSLFSDTVDVEFVDDKIKLIAGDGRKELRKIPSEFQHHQSASVLIFGACSVARDIPTLKIIRQLFDNPLILAFAGVTGISMNNAMLNEFFKKIRSEHADQNTIMDAWLRAMDGYYGGGENESKFRAISPEGQEWQIKNSEIIRGRTM